MRRRKNKARKQTGAGGVARAERSGARSVSLPVLPKDHTGRKPIRPSRNATKRAIVLAVIQILIIVHVIQWVIIGRTTTPIEPSEAMEFTRSGVINAGLIFFALALLATMLLGRWVCGWGCHVILLQDFCGWVMKKCGIRPRAFRSRFLVYVPLILALYMFIWPAFYRLAVAPWIGTSGQLEPWHLQTHLVTEDFWQTFPGVMVAIPFLLICGFATVYFLGSKGFCTYGCPYGGFFAPLDELSPGRIRVTNDCQQSGHCTARCTSNVRVHEEVREYGMVVDPGCMKCLDCVSVCPNDALYFGFGKPAIRKGEPKQQAPKKQYDLTLGEEAGMSAVFLLSFLAFRGVYGLIPMLMAVGMAGVTTFIIWKFWRMFRDANVSFHRARFKSSGRLTRRGWAFASCAILVLAFTVHSGVVRGAEALGRWHFNSVTVPPDLVLVHGAEVVPDEMRVSAQRGLTMLELASAVGHGGIGVLAHWQPMLDMDRAWLHAVLGEYETAEWLARRAMSASRGRRATDGEDYLHAQLGQLLVLQQKYDDAEALYRERLLEHRQADAVLRTYAQWMTRTGRVNAARDLLRQRLEQYPDDVMTHYWLGVLTLEAGETTQGVAKLRNANELHPSHAETLRILALALSAQGEYDEAESLLVTAVEEQPHNPRILRQLAQLLAVQDRHEEAREYEVRAQKAEEGRRPVERPQEPSPLR